MSDFLDTPEMREAEEKLRRGLSEIFSKLPLIPDVPIHSVDNWGEFAEDGQTLIVVATLADGMQLYVSMCPGKPLAVSVQDLGIRPPFTEGS